LFWTFVIRALEYRKRRLLLAFSALAVAATLATVLFGIYGTVEQRFRDEFRGYGANIAAVPVSGKTVPLAIAAAAEKLGAEAAPFLITSGLITSSSAGARQVPVAGFVPAKSAQMTSYWHMKEGRRDIGPGECMAGEFIATRLQLKVGATVPLASAPCTLKGIVSTGGAEDQEILVPFAVAAKLAGVPDAASVIEIRAPGGQEEEVRAALAKEFPAADVRTNLAVAGTESNVVFQIRASLFLLTLLILGITTLCVTSSFSELVIERSKEIGILKALGGAERKIAAFFISESAMIALAATLAGYAMGVFAAAGIGRGVFGGGFRLEPSWAVLGGVAGVMLAVAGVATAIAASRIWSIQPAVILRGE
jgi:putative ABC transport system permease protein